MADKKPESKGSPWQSADAANHFGVAIGHHQAGRLREAEQHYRHALAADPGHVESLHLLGVIAHQVGHNEIAIELIGKALVLNDRAPEFHYNIGLAYGALGRFTEAAAHNAKAIALRPDHAEAHLNLGNALLAQGKAAAAIDSYRHVIRLRPDSAVAHYNLANALAEAGRGEDAETHYARALTLKPDYAEAHNNLGVLLLKRGKAEDAAERHRRALAHNPRLATARANLGNAMRTQGRLDEAIACYREALAQDANQAEAHLNLGITLMARGETDEAALSFKRALALMPDPAYALLNLAHVALAQGDIAGALAGARRLHDTADTPETRALFYDCFRDPRASRVAAPYRKELIEAMREGWGNPRAIAPLAGQLIMSAIDRHGGIDAAELVQAAEHDELLLAMMESAPVNDERLERVLSAARAALLAAALDPASGDEAGAVAFACAMARQCFLNDYVLACTGEEDRALTNLLSSTREALRSDAPVSARTLAALGSYLPLHRLDGCERLADRPWPAPVQSLLAQQIAEPRAEARIRETIPRMTAISDGISQAVRAQYEESPYPRWTAMAPPSKRHTVDAHIREFHPLSGVRALGKPQLDYLIAGCGTGHQIAQVMRVLDGIRVTAVDLSLASLGYAKRKIDELGYDTVRFGQADILELGSLNESFDVIDTTGVLHHMRDPLAGWRVLASLLRPNGLMHVALYSTAARRHITAARDFVASSALPPTPEGIRRGRAGLLAMPDGTPARSVTKLWDFWTLSECRDLLFHVQEHTFDVPQIAAFLAENRFDFLGFEPPAHVAGEYAKRFPGDPAKTNLENWNLFEQDNPDSFIAMYQFWVQKRPG